MEIRLLRVLIAAVLPGLLSAVVSACGGPSTPAPSATASSASSASARPSASQGALTPSPHPVTAAAVLSKLSDPGYSFVADLSGTLVVGAASRAVMGAEQYSAGDSYSLIVADVVGVPDLPDVVSRSERTIVGDTLYSRTSENSPWFAAPRVSDAGGVAGAIVRVGALVDKGPETRSGAPVHHFATDQGSVTAAELGALTEGVADFGGTLDLYVDASATLVGFSVNASWRSTPGSFPVSISFDYSITGARPSIVAPSDVWTRFTSTRWGYSIGYPPTVSALEGRRASAPDRFDFPDGEYYTVARAAQPSRVKLADYVKAYVAATSTQYRVKPDSQLDITIDGSPGTILQYHLKLGGASHFEAVAMTLHGSDGYTIAIVAAPGSEADALSFLDIVLGTFAVAN